MSSDHGPPSGTVPPYAAAVPTSVPPVPVDAGPTAGLPVRIEFSYTPAEMDELRAPLYPSAGLVTLRPDPPGRRWIGPGIMATIMLVYVAIGVSQRKPVEGLAAAGVIAAIYAFALWLSWLGSGRRNRFRPMPDAADRYVVDVAAGGMTVVAGGRPQVWSWWSVDGWGDTPAFLVLRRKDGARVAIPRRAMSGRTLRVLVAAVQAAVPSFSLPGTAGGFPVLAAPPPPRH
ncbi:MAG TPA: hypothetical protein VF796_26545 [Humisphaera sp.]